MPDSNSLDQLITKHAAELAQHVRAAAAVADKEEEIRIEVEKQLAFLQKAAGITLKGKHEFTVASGRVDSVYQRVIIEYKNPSSAAKIGDTLDSPGSKKVVEQIKNRFRDLQTEEGQPIERLFGVGCDGNRFIFVRWRDKKWDIQQPVEVNKYTAERFLWALFNLGEKGKAFRPEYLAADFGSNEGSIALKGIPILYEAICNAKSPKAKTFFNQWKILFGEVCGYDVDNPSDKIKKLAKSYGVTKNIKPAELLFAVHTYYAVFMKLLAGGVVARFHKLPDPVNKLHHAATPAKFKAEMEELEKGSIFRHFNITNFLEGDLFAWYLPEWTDDIYGFLKGIVSKFDDYNPQTLAEEPNVSRDLLKKLYQELFPKSVRHDLGEYYTPDWLAEHVLNEVGYEGDPDKRILDPACGSGTFLVLAINRIRQWYEDHREEVDYEEDELARKILANCIGFDLNPLAVMAARTNYLIAIRGLIDRVDRIEIPVYLCDSILTPSTYGGLFAGETTAAKELKTAAAKFIVPVEIAQNSHDVGKYAEVLEHCVQNAYSPDEFIERCQTEGLPVTKKNLHTELYKELVALDKANKNGVWARIIKNSFAPLFVGKMDFVVGNPPWINWENLPQAYREDSLPVWNRYGLKDSGLGRSAIGKSKHEVAGLFLYVSADHYSKRGGLLGFVVTQSLFKNKGAAGFRKLQLDGRWLEPTSVTDMIECHVFSGAINRTATIVVQQVEKEFDYPVNYTLWYPTADRELPEDAEYSAIQQLVDPVSLTAFPSQMNDRSSPWLTCPQSVAAALDSVLGEAYFRAFEGVNSGGLVGAYWMRKISEVSDQHWLMENLGNAGKIRVPIRTAKIERELLYPFIRGRDVKRWLATEFCQYLMTHDPATRAPLRESQLKTTFPNAWEYLLAHKKQLLTRRTAPVRQQMDRGFFYAILGIGPHTVSDWKVVFKDLTELFQCCVIGPDDSSDPNHVIVPDCTLRLIPAQSELEAHYVAALLNSAPAMAALYYSSAGVQTQRYHAADAEKIAVRPFRAETIQRRLAELSLQCHQAARAGRTSDVRLLEVEIDRTAAAFWGIDESDSRTMRTYLDRIASKKRGHPDGD